MMVELNAKPSRCPSCGEDDPDHISVRSEVVLVMTVGTAEPTSDVRELSEIIRDDVKDMNYSAAITRQNWCCDNCGQLFPNLL